MTVPARILLIEDDPSLAGSLERVLANEGYSVAHEKRGDTGLNRAIQDSFDIVLTDLRLPGCDGLDLVRRLHNAKPRLPAILMTAHGTTESAIEATKFGAYDYLLKPFEMDELVDVVARAVAASRLMSEPVELGTAGPAGASRNAIVGNSRAMQSIYKEIGRVAAKPLTVLLRGETGTGKELIARAIYQHSDLAQGPFVAINCAAIPETLLESELFGHERGTFTGAEARRIGRFEQAHQGTLFLDEIGDLNPGTQAKLLRVLQEKCIQRLGGKETIPVDVRVITATHRDLEAAIREGTFREDLFYRLNVAVITLPPLRERKEDIPTLVSYFLRRYGPELGAAEASVQPEALELLQAQNWPGNIRELENVVRKALLSARGYTITPEHVRSVLAASASLLSGTSQPMRDFVASLLAATQRGEMSDAHGALLRAAEMELIRQAIELTRGNQAQAARWLGISRLTMREKLTQFGLHPHKTIANDAGKV
jgi:two-component system, NtrC family, response regulator